MGEGELPERSSLPLLLDLLGPLELRVDGQHVAVPGELRRAMLALLALDSGRTVTAGRLVESLWPEEAPDNAQQALYSHVSRLRRHLGPYAARLVRVPGGYRLQLAPWELDVDAARRLAARTGGGDDPRNRAARAAAALSLWRGPALGEFGALPSLEVESVGLAELRSRLTDDLTQARLDAGDPSVAVDAAAAAAGSPLRERTQLLHVRALAAEGRGSEAMAAAQAFRQRLAEEAGLDPGPALADLEQQVAGGAFRTAAETSNGLPGRAARVVTPPDGPLFGRREERADVVRLLVDHPVVTLSGPGGVGKTRLALDVAADPAAAPVPGSDAVLADLSTVDRPDRLCEAVASVLGLRTAPGVGPGEVAGALRGEGLLLVLDNCEHLAEACRELVVALRREAPGVRVLATSRFTLHVPGEYVVRLQPLAVPRDGTDPDSVRRLPVVRAFLEHARRRSPGFELTDHDLPVLLDVLRRLDGLPLGIELAARQVAVMPLGAVRERVGRALDLATGRSPHDDRQQTLRAVIGASYQLLDPDRRALLRALAPFPGGVDLPTVEDLARSVDATGDPVDLLHGLVDASLVVADPSRDRYRLLFTVRSFLLDELRRLEELRPAEQRFLDHSLRVADELGVDLLGPGEAAADRRLRAELDNLRAARDVARDHGREDVRIGITLALNEAATWRDLRELWGWALELAEDPELSGHPLRPAILASAADAARQAGDLDGALRIADAAFDAAGDYPEPGQLYRAWSARGSVAHFRGDFATAEAAWLRAGEGRPQESGAFLAVAALAAGYRGDRDRAFELLEEARRRGSLVGVTSHLAFAAYVEGELQATVDPVGAIPLYEEAIDLARRVGASFPEGVASVALASARTRAGDLAAAARGFAYLLESWRRTGQQTQLWTTARNAAGLLAATGHGETAALLLISADDAPAAAAVGREIARHSGRVYVPVADLVEASRLVELRAEAAAAGPWAVVDRAVTELRRLSHQPPEPGVADRTAPAGHPLG